MWKLILEILKAAKRAPKRPVPNPKQFPKKEPACVLGCKGPPKKIDEKRKDHIFRDKEGHLKDTPENRKLLEDTASDPKNHLGSDRFNNDWYARTNADGTQTWVQTRGDSIINGGVNATPRPYSPLTGLSGTGP